MTARRDNALKVVGLQKSYGGVEAVPGIDFSVEYGECFCPPRSQRRREEDHSRILEGISRTHRWRG